MTGIVLQCRRIARPRADACRDMECSEASQDGCSDPSEEEA
jgi:hypothetical protein